MGSGCTANKEGIFASYSTCFSGLSTHMALELAIIWGFTASLAGGVLNSILLSCSGYTSSGSLMIRVSVSCTLRVTSSEGRTMLRVAGSAKTSFFSLVFSLLALVLGPWLAECSFALFLGGLFILGELYALDPAALCFWPASSVDSRSLAAACWRVLLVPIDGEAKFALVMLT